MAVITLVSTTGSADRSQTEDRVSTGIDVMCANRFLCVTPLYQTGLPIFQYYRLWKTVDSNA